MSETKSDIINQYRSGGTGKSNATNVVDYYNQKIAEIQSGQIALANNKYTPYQNQSIALYQNASNQASQLQNDYQKALEQQSLNKQYAQKYLNTQLGMQGLSQVGSSESSANAIASQYANNVANLQSNYAKDLQQVEQDRVEQQLLLDEKKIKQDDEKITAYSDAIKEANNLEDLERIKNLYSDITENAELTNQLHYKYQDFYTDKVGTELANAIKNGNNSRENLTNILSQYKDVLSDTRYKEFENDIESESTAGEIRGYVAEGTEPLKIDAYTNATDLTSQLKVNQGEKQTKYVESILNDLKSGKISNGSFVQLNYGETNKKYNNIYYVYNNQLYKVDKTKAKAGGIINQIYLPEGYKADTSYGDKNGLVFEK